MLNIFLKIYDTIFPPHQCLLQIQGETKDSFVRFLRPQKIPGVIYLSDFQIKSINSAITANKFYNSTHASQILGSILATWLKDLPSGKTALVPIPLSYARQKERGYNQVTRILENIDIDNFVVLEVLEKTRHTVPQTSLSRKERLKNINGAFSIKNKSELADFNRIIIIDDVVTTGTTLKVAKVTLLPYVKDDQELICLAIAH